MDEVQQRLRDTTDACLKSLENWHKQGKNVESREELMESIHEVRKVCARLEIEIAISERDRMGSRPIPIPPHRSSMKGNTQGDSMGDDQGDMDEAPSSHQGGSRRMNSQGGGRPNRRPMHQGQQGGRPQRGGEPSGETSSGNTPPAEL